MVKYIDVEKLKAEIERLYDGEAPKHDQQCDFDDGYFTGIGAISKFIDSLQQEQQTDKQVVVITESHGDANIEWDCRSIDDVKELLAAGARYVSKEQEQPDFPTTDEEIEIFLATHPKVEVPQKYKTPDWLLKKQEQPEVDLEKELDRYLRGEFKQTAGGNFNNYIQVARHFFALGRNARKEESK